MKKSVLVLAALALAAAPVLANCGDVDDNGNVDVLDALITGQASAAIVQLNGEQTRRADVNSSGTVEILDALLIAQSASGLPSSLACVAGSAPPPVGSPPGKLYLGKSTQQVMVVDSSTQQTLATVSVGHGVRSIVSHPSAPYVYVGSTSGQITVLDTSNDAVLRTVSVPGLNGDLDIAQDGSSIAGIISGGVVILDLPALTVRHSVSTGSNGGRNHVAIDRDAQFVYASQSDHNAVRKIDMATGQVVATISVGSAPYGVDVSLDNSRVYVINHGERTLSRIDTSNDTEILPRQPVGNYPMAVLAHSNGYAYAVNCVDWAVGEHDGVSGVPSRVHSVGPQPVDMVECHNRHFAVVNSAGSFVTIVDPATGTRVDVQTGSSLSAVGYHE
jgi:YVTN family beta-propeller protein